MIVYKHGNLLDSSAEVIVNPVNCVGVMGKGLALAFKEKFGEQLVGPYKKACALGTLRPGTPQSPIQLPTGQKCINFPTKSHWRDPSRIEWIEEGLIKLRFIIESEKILSIGIPRLGCGLGGLDWDQVHKLICQYLSDITVDLDDTSVDVNVYVYV